MDGPIAMLHIGRGGPEASVNLARRRLARADRHRRSKLTRVMAPLSAYRVSYKATKHAPGPGRGGAVVLIVHIS